MPLVSVVIPTYNYAHFVSQAIQSVLDQTFRDFEIIVVDDGSTDDTFQVVSPFGDPVRYIRQANRGPNAARNTGIRTSTGKYVALLDADDLWLPHKLESQIPLIEADPEVGLVYASMYLFDSETGAIVDWHPPSRCRQGHVLRQLYMDQFVPSPTPLIRRKVFDEVGYFDESVVSPDDWEMWLRIAARYKFAFVREPLAMYRVHASIAGSKHYDLYEMEMLAFFEKAAKIYSRQLGSLRRLRLSTFKESMGWRLVERGNRHVGRGKLLEAIRFSPFRLRPYLLLMASFVAVGSTPESYRVSRLEYALGKHSLFSMELREARMHFLRAIKSAPWRSRAYAGLILSLCGPWLVALVRQRRGIEFYGTGPAASQDIAFEQW